MDLHKVASFALVPELPVIPHQIPRRKQLSTRPVRFSVRVCFGERFIVSSSSRWRNIENRIENVNDGNSIEHPAVSKSDTSSRMAELSFNRLQLSDEECRGLLRRNFDSRMVTS